MQIFLYQKNDAKWNPFKKKSRRQTPAGFFITRLNLITPAPQSAAHFPPRFLSAGAGNTPRQAGRSSQADK